MKKIIYCLFFCFASLVIMSCDFLSPESEVETPSVYTVTFNSNAGEETVTNMPSSLVNVAKNSLITKPTEIPVRSGKNFTKWYTDNACTTEWNFTSDKVTTDITLYAGWSNIQVLVYTVTFDANAGSDVVTNMPSNLVNVTANSLITSPTEIPVRSGKNFTQWYKDAACTTEWNFTSDYIRSDVTLYAGWTENPVYTISFVTNNENISIPSLKAEENKVVNIKKYYQDWCSNYSMLNLNAEYRPENNSLYLDSDLQNDIALNTTNCQLEAYTVTEDISYYVLVEQYFTVELNANGGKFSDDLEVINTMRPKNDSVAYMINNTIPTRTGYLFKEWTTDVSGNNAYNLENALLTENLTLYAQWQSVNNYLNGYWVSESSNQSFYLDVNAATSIFISEYGNIYSVQITGSSVITNGTTYVYSYDNEILTINDVEYINPSSLKAKGTAISRSDYVVNSNYKFSAETDGSLTISERGQSIYTGYWAKDDDYFYVLTDSNFVFHKYSLTDELYKFVIVDYSVLGNKYYNKAATIKDSITYPDAYSFYLDSEGTMTIWLWNKTIKGSWYTNSNSIYIRLDNCEYLGDYSYVLEDNNLTITSSEDVNIIFAQSTSKGTVSSFSAIEQNYQGEWQTSADGQTIKLEFTSTGEMITTMIYGPDDTFSVTDYYTAVDGNIYSVSNRVLREITQIKYSYDSEQSCFIYNEIPLTR